MNKTLALTPGGRLELARADEGAAAIPAEAAAALDAALATSSGEGLLDLSSQALAGDLPPEGHFWRGLGQQFFQAVCQLGEVSAERWKSIAPPVDEDGLRLAVGSPPAERRVDDEVIVPRSPRMAVHQGQVATLGAVC